MAAFNLKDFVNNLPRRRTRPSSLDQPHQHLIQASCENTVVDSQIPLLGQEEQAQGNFFAHTRVPTSSTLSTSGPSHGFYPARATRMQGIAPESSILDPVLVLPYSTSVGHDEIFKNLWGLLRGEEIGIVGIYGMGGVGKTTLLRRINNELEGTTDFEIVIWVVVSKEVNVDRIQRVILERLGLTHWEDRSMDQVSIFNFLRQRRFVLLFDDLWERLDLEEIGVPVPNQRNNSKILFTTRSEHVCSLMRAAKKIKVDCLDWEDGWALFRENVGTDALDSHSEIQNLAQKVAEECRGLPLALIVIARAMASKRTPQEWKHAMTTLHSSPSDISGTGKDLYYRMKLSYDMLPNEAIRKCFLYCSLFPEDYMIHKENLIYYWWAEGFLDGCGSMEETINKGYDVIGILIVSSLLESVKKRTTSEYEWYIKMHDVVRDMALWVTSESESKFLVKAGIGLNTAPRLQNWGEAERISFMDNKITSLLGNPVCNKLLTLMLQFNRGLNVSDSFFRFMPLLRVLDLSSTSLRVLPSSIGQLVNLHYLNLSRTYLKSLPQQLGDLQSLSHLNMGNIPDMLPFPLGIISRLSKLQVLDVLTEAFSIHDPECDIVDILELKDLEYLSDLSIHIRNSSSLKYLMKSHKLAQCITNLRIYLCPDFKSLHLLPSFGTRLYILHIRSCNSLKHIIIGAHSEIDRKCKILPCLEVLRLAHNDILESIQIKHSVGKFLEQLNMLVIDGCRLLREIDWAKHFENLAHIHIRENDVIENLFSSQSDGQQGLVILPRLKWLRLFGLTRLKQICKNDVVFPSLSSLEVYRCPLLKKLPLSLINEKSSLKTIEGDKEWWNSLVWTDEVTKSCFQACFKGDEDQ